MNIADLPLRINAIADALEARGAAAAANAMANEFHAELVDVTLRKSTHGPGEVTTSRPGEPPALVTGTLRRSARIVPAAAAGSRAVAAVRVGVAYARIQERGGTVTAKRKPYLRFQYPAGSWHSVRSVKLPARPYMAPTLALLLATGRLRGAAGTALAAVAAEASHG